jgi:hypothetical protein
MKRIFVAASLCLAVMTIASCAGVVTPTGYGTATSAFIYTHMTFPAAIQDTQLNQDDYKIIGEAHGTGSTNNILGIAAFGDGGVNKAYRDALEKSGGDDLINMRIDTEASSILYLFSTVTTHVYGTAIKYKK